MSSFATPWPSLGSVTPSVYAMIVAPDTVQYSMGPLPESEVMGFVKEDHTPVALIS